ncbi:PAS domain-containing protein [Paracoccus sp. DMF-8]|uniref:PAS domain-containing protein n=1 Tax=Paracoccus sp. DMF-8 TaxID=3019445 RepID=UPI0023E3ECD6|nr:PAS domain-containing protein [Paracoccus sp. DMF-8]MDF3608425.1 PAS domain-containing protein [Paracoccus sp. DMF-8]
MRLHESLATSDSLGAETPLPPVGAGADTPTALRPAEGSNAALALVLMRSLPESIYLISTGGRVVFANQPGLARFDQQGGAGVGHRKWLELWPDHDSQMLAGAFDDALDGDTTRLTVQSRDHRGLPLSCNLTIAPVEDASGAVSHVLCIAQDA